MTIEELRKLQIVPPSSQIYKQIKENWDRVAKPLNGLGRFEEMIARIGAIQGTTQAAVARRAVIVMCADNGIVAEGVSQSGQEVTAAVTRFMGQGKTSVGKMAKAAGAFVIPVDVGVNWEEEPVDLWKVVETEKQFREWIGNQDADMEMEGILHFSVRPGTADFLKEPAMTEQEALQAIAVGMQLVKWCKDCGYHMVATGEMGIGNTTTSSAVAAALLECFAEEVTGRGAGLDDAGLMRKCRVIKEALSKYSFRKEQTLQILAALGGLDIAGMAGICIGGALYHMPVVLDGVISAVAALTAERLVPGVKDFLIPSHASREAAAGKIMNTLSLEPVIYGDLALGEGTGAVMLFSLLDVAMSLYESDTTFQDMELKPYEHFDHSDT